MVRNGDLITNKIAKEIDGTAKELGMPGLGYLRVGHAVRHGGMNPGPMGKFFSEAAVRMVSVTTGASFHSNGNQVIFFLAGTEAEVTRWGGLLRTTIAEKLDLMEKNVYRFCWIVDFPMFEKDEATGQIGFSHNPFSMPHNGLEKGLSVFDQDPLDILAHQYDLVCNGYEIASGAVRNHKVDMLIRAFGIAGYPEETVRQKFPSLVKAFSYGAPPHAGIAPGIERILMLLADEPNVREVVPFPLNAQAACPLTGAPGPVEITQLRELSIRVVQPQTSK
jgi:aspartyl-tRNA synthetase